MQSQTINNSTTARRHYRTLKRLKGVHMINHYQSDILCDESAIFIFFSHF